MKSGTSQEGYYLATKEEVITNKDSIVQQINEWGTASFVAGTVSNLFLCSKRIFDSLFQIDGSGYGGNINDGVRGTDKDVVCLRK